MGVRSEKHMARTKAKCRQNA